MRTCRTCPDQAGLHTTRPGRRPQGGDHRPDRSHVHHGERLDADEQFRRYLLHKFGVAVVPGTDSGRGPSARAAPLADH